MIQTLGVTLAILLLVAVIAVSSTYTAHADPTKFRPIRWCYDNSVQIGICNFSTKGSCNKAIDSDPLVPKFTTCYKAK